MASAWWTVGGLFVNLIGVALLYRYGIPYRTLRDSQSYLLLEDEDPAERARTISYQKLGRFGLILIGFGTIAQIIGAVPS